MRLIDADALLYDLEIVPLTDDGGVDANDLDDIIKQQPTVEPSAEPKKGKWKHERIASSSGGSHAIVRCSNCEGAVPMGWGPPYCPLCGARMRGDNDE